MNSRDEFYVVINAAGEYSIWNILHPLPEGWVSAGFEGCEAICYQYIAALHASIDRTASSNALESQR